MALHHHLFNIVIFVSALITCLLFQLLANFANDLGDTLHGADVHRQGPLRLTQAGLLSITFMQSACRILATLAALSSLTTIFLAFYGQWLWMAIYSVLAALCIWASVRYTYGHRPYGYQGLGDLAVFCFFGGIGILATYALYKPTLDPLDILPAVTSGTLATAILNLNNIRDLKIDQQANKKTFALILGQQNACLYQGALIITGITTATLYLAQNINLNIQTCVFFAACIGIAANYTALVVRLLKQDLEPKFLNKQLKLNALLVLALAIGWSGIVGGI